MNDYDQIHAERYRLSLEALRPHLARGMRVLCLGDAGTFEKTIFDLTGDVLAYTYDLRKPFSPQIGGESIDLVLCMEVLEHVHDQEAEKPTEWRATGTRNLLAESFRLLKPGGLLFLTTPNACSLNALAKLLTMQPPMVFRPHVREYAPSELVAMVADAGFTIESVATHDCWGGGVDAHSAALIEELLARHAHASPHRGEDIFLKARKPAAISKP